MASTPRTAAQKEGVGSLVHLELSDRRAQRNHGKRMRSARAPARAANHARWTAPGDFWDCFKKPNTAKLYSALALASLARAWRFLGLF